MVVSCWKCLLLLLLPVLCVLSTSEPSSSSSSSSSTSSPSTLSSSSSSSHSSSYTSSSPMSEDLGPFQGQSTALAEASASAKDAGPLLDRPRPALSLEGDASYLATATASPGSESLSWVEKNQDGGVEMSRTDSISSLHSSFSSVTSPSDSDTSSSLSSVSSSSSSSSSTVTQEAPRASSESVKKVKPAVTQKTPRHHHRVLPEPVNKLKPSFVQETPPLHPHPPPHHHHHHHKASIEPVKKVKSHVTRKTTHHGASSSDSSKKTPTPPPSATQEETTPPPPPPTPPPTPHPPPPPHHHHHNNRASSGPEPVRKVSVRDERVLKAVEANLLGALGLSHRPRPSRDLFVPPYMLELYRQQKARGGRGDRSPVLGINSPFLKVAGRGGVPANTVRSFHHTDHSVRKGCDGATCSRLLFNISSISHTESLAGAELRLFLDLGDDPDPDPSSQGQQHPDVKADAGERSPSRRRQRRQDPHAHAFKVEVHEIMHVLPAGEEEEGEEEEDCISRLLDTKVIHSKGAGSAWESFDIHPAVLKWTRGSSFNKGLEVRLLPLQVANASLESHVRVRRSVSQSEETWQRQRPLLVTYTDDGRGALNSAASSHRDKRSAARSERKRERRRKKNRRDSKARRNRRNRKKKKKRKRKKNKRKKTTKKGDKNLCKRHPLYVDFEDVGWKDWIQAPEGFNAYFCHGDCNFPLPHHLNSTNHAIVRTLVNSVDPKAVPKACCVPTELSAISMLYTNEWDKTILKIYKDMVVEACGCR